MTDFAQKRAAEHFPFSHRLQAQGGYFLAPRSMLCTPGCGDSASYTCVERWFQSGSHTFYAGGDFFVLPVPFNPAVGVLLCGYRGGVVGAVEKRTIAVLLPIEVALEGKNVRGTILVDGRVRRGTNDKRGVG